MSRIKELMELAQNGCITHCDTFHADDCWSTALLIYCHEKWYNAFLSDYIDPLSKLERLSDKEIFERGLNDSNCLMYDIGKGRFDHHQPDCRLRDAENPDSKFAAFGLLWDYIGTEVMLNLGCTPNEAEVAKKHFDSSVVQYVDRTDNFGQQRYPNSMSSMIKMQNGPISDRDEQDKAFVRVVNLLLLFLEKALLESVNVAKQPGRIKKLIETATEEQHPEYVVLDDSEEYIPATAFKGTTVKAVVSACQGQRNPGCYQICCTDSENWKLSDSCRTSEGVVFYHNSGFMAIFETKDKAMDFLLKDLNHL